MKKEYTNGSITVIWQPELCTHAGVCFRSLPDVFRPRERPWIQMHQDNEKIISTVSACPSGAISIKNTQPTPMSDEIIVNGSKISVIPNGPAKIAGPCFITLPDGSIVEKVNGVSLCRCGLSANKPFCDGNHKTNGFNG